MLADSKVNDLCIIVNQLEKYLNKSFVGKIRIYLNGGCNKKPLFRLTKCKHKDILKNNIIISDIEL